ncbi:MAG: hypothetical protein PHR26_00170 [Candidatus ainarchaeum sp.]|nr:hypothetical protein [Candidatus ainarchaeum sp.]MDD3976065.1 hypothetical protein [Candidatus ainarchaeum sp.]
MIKLQKIGAYAFLLGILISIIFGLISSLTNASWVQIVLIVLGLVVGLLNIEDRNISLFLIATIAFIATSTSLNSLPIIGSIFRNVLVNMIHFIAPAALIVSIVAIIRVANNK